MGGLFWSCYPLFRPLSILPFGVVVEVVDEAVDVVGR